jgi:hypothetical protein
MAEFIIEIPEIHLKNALEPIDLDFEDIHKKAQIDLLGKPQKPPVAISIGYDDIAFNGEYNPLIFGTFGNISMIKGEEKARKSWLKSLILGCAIGGNANLFSKEIRGHCLDDKYIIDVDTEQDKYYNWLSANRIPKMIGSAQKPIVVENYISINLREHSAKIRREYLKWLFMESEYRNKLGIVSIDGYVDMLDNFNDLVECVDFTQALMRYSTISKCHITGVLHLNPGQDKARGHLGTILQQKCETVVIIKDEGDHSNVNCQRGRGKKFKDFKISVNNDWLPYVLEDEDFLPQTNYYQSKDKPLF